MVGEHLQVLLAREYLCYDALLARLSELLPGNEVDGAPGLLHRGHHALSALHGVRK